MQHTRQNATPNKGEENRVKGTLERESRWEDDGSTIPLALSSLPQTAKRWTPKTVMTVFEKHLLIGCMRVERNRIAKSSPVF